jgi:hypothetical protein
MKLQELQDRALKLAISDRWRLVQSVLTSIQQETQSSIAPNPTVQPIPNLDPWNQSLIGVIQLSEENPTDSYVNYLEEKYR